MIKIEITKLKLYILTKYDSKLYRNEFVRVNNG